MKTTRRSSARVLRVALPALAAVACGGSDDGGRASGSVGVPAAGSPSVRTAVLLDGVVAGARYESGHLRGVTDASGRLRYVEGEPVRVFVGGIALGEAHPVPGGASLAHLAADHVLTPLELAGADGDLDDTGALDRVRLLMALDDDQNADNGIRITSAVDAALTDVATPAFGADAPFASDAALVAALAAVAEVRGARPVLAGEAAARAHLCASLARVDCGVPGLVDSDVVPDAGAARPDPVPVVEPPATETPVAGPSDVEPSVVEPPVVESPAAGTPITEMPVVEPPAVTRPPSVDVVNAAPRLVGVPPSRAAVGEPWRFAVTATDDDGDTLAFSLDGAPRWMTLDAASGALSGTPSAEDVGRASGIVLSVGDGVDTSALATFAVDVYQANRAPRLAGTPPATIDVGASLDFVPEASDADDDELYFVATGLPAWADVDPLTGALSGTPAAADAGSTASVTLRATDGEASATLGPFDIVVVQPNRAPRVDGLPAAHVLVGEPYSFVPEASDADGDALSWSATALPAWMTLDAGSGVLSGTPSEAGAAVGITLLASDGHASTALGPFDVTALDEVDLARAATATQGSTYGTGYLASVAIDGDDASFNHTACVAGGNWLQIDLGRPAVVSRLVVVNRSSNRRRLDGASVHVGDRSRMAGPFDDVAFPAARVATLDDGARQEIRPDAPRLARYVTLETPGAACLHVGSVEVHGRHVDAPAFPRDTVVLGAVPPVRAGDVVGVVRASDAQGDAVRYRVDGDVPFAIDAQGTVTATRALEHNRVQRHDFRVVASDGRHETDAMVTVRMLDGNGARVERWNELPGLSLTTLTDSPRFVEAADEIGTLPGLEQPGIDHGDYGERLSALLRPPESGDYVFSVTGDDATSLALAPVGSAATLPVIAARNSWRAFRDYDGGGHSEPVRLEAGHLYRVEVLHKESGGGNHVSVGWRPVDGSAFEKLPDALVHVGLLDAETSRPRVAAHVAEHLVERDAADGRVVVELDARDAQGDVLAYGIVADVPFAVDANGRVTVDGVLEPGRRYDFDVTIGDGTHTVVRALSVETTASDAIERALASGDASAVTERELVDALTETRARLAAERTDVLDALFGRDDATRAVGPLDWDPTHDSAVLEPLALGGTQPVLISNDAAKRDGTIEETLALAGRDANGARLLLFGGNPVHALARGGDRGGTANAAMQTFMENAVHWLADGKTPDDAAFDVVVAHLPDHYWARHDDSMHAWLADTFPAASVNAEDACESAALAGCLADADLLVIGNGTGSRDDHGAPFDAAAVLAAVRDARTRGVAILFVRNGYAETALDTALMPELGVASGWNYWRQERLAGFVPSVEAIGAGDALAQLVASVEALDGGAPDGADAAALDVDYTADGACTSYVGRITCHEDRLFDGDGTTLDVRIGRGRESLRTRLRALDLGARDLFSLDDAYRPTKLAVLLGDKYRDAVRFPLDKLASDPRAFQRARFADAAVHYARSGNPMQPDMGRFTDAQRALHDGRAVTRVFARTPTAYSEWTSSGVYVPPGRPIVVTRTDASTAAVRVRFNMLRDTTRVWNANGYDRPSALASHDVLVPGGGSVTLSSPHGGPLYVWTAAVAADDPDAGVPVTLTFEGVLDNPLLDAFDEASVVAFSDALRASDSDWVDIRTPFAEIHSLKAHVINAFAAQDGDASDGYTTADVLDYVEDLNGYLIKGNYEYAGFASDALAPLGRNVADWCAARTLTAVEYGGESVDLCRDARIHALPRVQHINAGIAAQCGGLCAGNPFDSGYPVDPLGWGENHEMGHNLQRARLKIYGGRSGEVSNNIFPLQTSRRHAIDEGLQRHPSLSRPNHRGAFDILQAAIAAGTAADAEHPLWSGTGTYDLAFERLSFFVQLVYATGEWEFYTKTYVAERILEDASRDEAKWLAVRERLGLGGYTASAARDISGNDFLYLMASIIDGSDYADWFAAWGVEVSEAARAQVAANGIVATEPVVFRYVSGTLPVATPSGTIPLDGVSAWVDPEG